LAYRYRRQRVRAAGGKDIGDEETAGTGERADRPTYGQRTGHGRETPVRRR